MEVYQNRLKQLLRLFPKEVLASNHKDSSYAPMPSYHALKDNKFIQYNSRDRINIIAIDIDHHQDGGVWLDEVVPQPTWTVWTDKGIQFFWVLEKPVLAADKSTMKYLKDVLNKLVYTFEADINAIGFHRVFRNPLNHQTHYSDTRVNLKDFKGLETPPQTFWDKIKARSTPEPRNTTLFSDITSPQILVSFQGMKQGDGRNIALFDRLRFYAYDLAKSNGYSEFDLAYKALVINQDFQEPLESKELNQIISSIDRFIENKYQKGRYMQTTTPEERKEIASKNGKIGGAATATKRKLEASSRIAATINQMESFSIKITVSEVARRAKSTRPTVRAYLSENGWQLKSLKQGWIRA